MPLYGIDVSLSPFLSLSKTNEKKKCSQVTIKKKDDMGVLVPTA